MRIKSVQQLQPEGSSSATKPFLGFSFFFASQCSYKDVRCKPPFPYYSHTIPIRIPLSMGMIWEAYGNGGPTIEGPWKIPNKLMSWFANFKTFNFRIKEPFHGNAIAVEWLRLGIFQVGRVEDPQLQSWVEKKTPSQDSSNCKVPK